MKKKKTADIFAYLSVCFGSIWLGAYVTRIILTYNLFREGELVLKNYINNTNINGILEAFTPLFYITAVTYIIFIINFILFIISSDIKLKNNGWLLITSLIIFFTLPFELILMSFDYKLILLHISDNFDSELILKLIIERLEILGSFSVILIFSYLTIPYFLIFKPFSLKKDI